METNAKEKTTVVHHEVCSKGLWVKDIKVGDQFIGFYVARNPRLDPYRDPAKGKYLRLSLSDRTGFIPARIWEDAETAASEILDGKPIKVDALAEQYKDELQIHIRRYRLVTEGEVQRSDLIKSTVRDVETMWVEVQEAIRSVKDTHISALLRYFFDDVDFTASFTEIPAARVIHHSHMSGLLEHCYELLMLAKPLLGLYPEIDRDVLTAGILLHDVGKLDEYDYEYDTIFTDAGKLIGHVVLSERRVSTAIRTIEGFPQSRENEILHLILSHHGRYEWGATRRPKSLEAVALHHLDNLDAQVNRFNQLLETARDLGKTWTDYDRMLGRMLYAGDRNGLPIEENGFVE
jgi:3'-5' exoribonuclease